MIAIVNYGWGNIRAIANIYKKLNIAVSIAESVQDLRAADKIILPGVGAFDSAMQSLNDSGLRAALEEAVVTTQKPVLGICVGMQMLARRSEEGELDGLGWIEAEVRKFDTAHFPDPTHLPHMGWNDVRPRDDSDLFRELGTEARFYFLHSYYFAPAAAEDVLAETDYYGAFVSSVRSQHIFGVQFHPEKSHQWGITLLRNFAELKAT
jgi:glutamine amidotransferase